MISYVKNLLASLTEDDIDPVSEQEKFNLAAAILLVEVMMADHEVDPKEIEQVTRVLQEEFAITPSKSQFLYEQAREQHEELVSLQALTSVINSKKDQNLKRRVIFCMWSIALADGVKDKYEEHLIRKVADLLYVSHTDFIKARHEAETRYTN